MVPILRISTLYLAQQTLYGCIFCTLYSNDCASSGKADNKMNAAFTFRGVNSEIGMV